LALLPLPKTSQKCVAMEVDNFPKALSDVMSASAKAANVVLARAL